MKIKEYPKATSLENTDAFVVETANGTKYAEKSLVSRSVDVYDDAVEHRSTYRGKYLGTSFTAAQKEAIRSGTFDELYIGDYWTYGGVNYRIADINYYMDQQTDSSASTRNTTNHIIVIPDTNLYTSTFGNGDKVVYPNSTLKSGLSTAQAKFASIFGSSNFIDNIYVNEQTNADYQQTVAAYAISLGVDIPTLTQMFGSIGLLPTSTNSDAKMVRWGSCYEEIETPQFKLFEMAPGFIKATTNSSWTKTSLSNSASYYRIMGSDYLAKRPAWLKKTDTAGVRPYAIIKG